MVPPPPDPYRVVYSELVRQQLAALIGRAYAADFGSQAMDALKDLDRRLRTYPQFGDPLRDLPTLTATQYAAPLPPLFVKYVIDESNRTVFVVEPLKALPHAGFE